MWYVDPSKKWSGQALSFITFLENLTLICIKSKHIWIFRSYIMTWKTSLVQSIKWFCKKTHGRKVQSRCSILTRRKEIERQRNSFPLTSLIDHSHHSLTPSSTFWKICLTILDFFCWISSPFTRQFGMKKLTFFEIKRHSVIGLVVDRSVTSSLGHHRLCWLLAATSEYHGALAPAFFDVWKEPLLTWNPYSILKELHKLYHMGLVALMHGILATWFISVVVLGFVSAIEVDVSFFWGMFFFHAIWVRKCVTYMNNVESTWRPKNIFTGKCCSPKGPAFFITFPLTYRKDVEIANNFCIATWRINHNLNFIVGNTTAMLF